MQCVCRIYAVGGRNEGLGNDLPTKDPPCPRREAQSLGPKQAHIELLHLQSFCDLLVLQLNLRVGHCLRTRVEGSKAQEVAGEKAGEAGRRVSSEIIYEETKWPPDGGTCDTSAAPW